MYHAMVNLFKYRQEPHRYYLLALPSRRGALGLPFRHAGGDYLLRSSQMFCPEYPGNGLKVVDLARRNPRDCLIERQREHVEKFALVARYAGEA